MIESAYVSTFDWELERNLLCPSVLRRAGMGKHRSVTWPTLCVCVCLRCNCTSLVWREAEVRDEFGGSHLDDHEQPWVQIAGFGVPPTHALPKTVSTMEGSGAGNRF